MSLVSEMTPAIVGPRMTPIVLKRPAHIRTGMSGTIEPER
jgi:hypothetical protein